MKSQDIRTLLISSFNFALGRMSYIVSDTVRIIIENQEHLTENDCRLMVRDIRQAIEQQKIGMECDKAVWLHLVEELSARLIKNGGTRADNGVESTNVPEEVESA